MTHGHWCVANLDLLHRILGQILTSATTITIGISDMPDALFCKTWMSPPEHRRAVWTRSLDSDSRAT